MTCQTFLDRLRDVVDLACPGEQRQFNVTLDQVDEVWFALELVKEDAIESVEAEEEDCA